MPIPIQTVPARAGFTPLEAGPSLTGQSDRYKIGRERGACVPRRLLTGFTLIEILVVVSIISIVSALVITTLSSNKAVTAAEQSAQAFLAHLRQAQNSALTGQNSSIAEDNCYIAVRIESATRYRVVNYYRSGGSCGSSYNTLAVYNLTNGARFSGMSYPTTLAFLLPRAEVYRSTGGALAAMGSTQMVSFTRSGQTRSVCLYPTGRVEAVGPATSCP